ncbi:MAG: creatininase family protein [Lentisphaerae bacterium]|nr:creatininase family protein [Lentisphaerota bacterium]
MFTWENTWKEIEDAKVRTAVVPIGSTEQHGTNLPLSTDTLITDEIARTVAAELNAYLTPTIPIGQSGMWLEFPGSLSFSEDTLKAIIADIVASLVKTGFTTIIFISVHGANEVVYRGYPEELSKRYPGVRIFTAGYTVWVRDHWVEIWRRALQFAGLPEMIHADEAEGSLVASIRPDLVGPNPTDCPMPSERYPKGKTMRQAYPSGSMGRPSRISKEKGAIFRKELLQLILEDIRKQFRSMPPGGG